MADDRDEDDIVVLRVCAQPGCLSVDDLQFDEDTSEMYCVACRELFRRAAVEGFHVLLSDSDVALAGLIHTAFDAGAKGHWDAADFVRFEDAVGREESGLPPSGGAPAKLRGFFHDEYDIELGDAGVVTATHLAGMYGGFAYNGQRALQSDAEALSDAGTIHLATLE